jgi:hypothetical protein
MSGYVGFHFEVSAGDFDDNRAAGRVFYSSKGAVLLDFAAVTNAFADGNEFVVSRRVRPLGETAAQATTKTKARRR